jgi:hypothetical protein
VDVDINLLDRLTAQAVYLAIWEIGHEEHAAAPGQLMIDSPKKNSATAPTRTTPTLSIPGWSRALATRKDLDCPRRLWSRIRYRATLARW